MPNAMLDNGFPAAVPAEARASYEKRWRALVNDHVDFIWRTLPRLGVLDADLADAAQQVFLVVARKLDKVREGSERGFLFQTDVRVASDSRRTRSRRREVPEDLLDSLPDEVL